MAYPTTAPATEDTGWGCHLGGWPAAEAAAEAGFKMAPRLLPRPVAYLGTSGLPGSVDFQLLTMPTTTTMGEAAVASGNISPESRNQCCMPEP